MKKWQKLEGSDPWWVLVLKAIAYIIGLILGGIGTVSAATSVGLL